MDLREPTKQLLLDVKDRNSFGIGAAPKPKKGRRTTFITELIQSGLVEGRGYFEKSGQPRFILTPCGKRAAELLQDIKDNPLAERSIRDTYDEGQCPLDDDPDDDIDYHSSERWIED